MTIGEIQSTVIACRKCPRLVRWREKTAREKVKRYANERYWGKPIPGFGTTDAGLLLIGLAPAAHGGNRTGRMFTGDRSGDWLFRALHKAGFANKPESVSRADGLRLTGCFITATCRCAPPQNKLLPVEIRRCRPFLLDELRLLKRVRVIVGLGRVGFDSAVACAKELGWMEPGRRYVFGHGVEYPLIGGRTILGCYHPSQQNTFTGKLTEEMLDAVFQRANRLLGSR